MTSSRPRTSLQATSTRALGADAAAPVIRVRELSHSLTLPAGPLDILRSVSFDVAEGEQVCILGRSGSGKSTLLELLATLSTPRPGSVFVAGHDLGRLSERQRTAIRRKTVGFVFQGFHLIDHLTAAENVAVPLRYAGVTRRTARQRAIEQLALVGLGEKAGIETGALSGGERQRVAIARATVHDPKVLFADEPTGSLDVETGELVLEALMRSSEGRRTLVLVTHSPEIAGRFPRRLVLESGVLS